MCKTVPGIRFDPITIYKSAQYSTARATLLVITALQNLITYVQRDQRRICRTGPPCRKEVCFMPDA
jgi:hypothetical protein